MGKAQQKRVDETDLQFRSRIANARADERARAEPLVTPEAEQHGDYVDHGLGRAGQRAKLNRGGSTIDRWKAEWKDSSDPSAISALAGVGLCQRLWHIAEGKSVGSGTGVKTWVSANGSIRWAGQGQQDALNDLHDFKTRLPHRTWKAFEACCREERPAADAGHHLATNDRDRAVKCKENVMLAGSMIAVWRGL